MKPKLLLLIVISLLLFSCNKTTKSTGSSKEPDVVIAYEDWSENKAFTMFAKRLLESNGYQVKTILVKDGVKALNSGKADVFLEKWMSHSIHVQGTQKLAVLGNIYEGGKIGLVVPNYMDITSIAELKGLEKEIGGKIYSIAINHDSESFAGVSEVRKRYDLNVESEYVTEVEMIKVFENLYMNRVPFCITGWEPHPMLDHKYIKMLEDPYSAFDTNYALVKYCTRSWASNHPKLKKFFKSYAFNKQQVDILIQKMGENDWDLKKSVLSWYNELAPSYEKALE
ncbi:glycine betaine ABC transporter substrate-binding protein [Prolixibacteraceae bacterium]|nr:glycine betaine ABC transporter substrate-binding protein [Prolixibacteraceae bacterium]